MKAVTAGDVVAGKRLAPIARVHVQAGPFRLHLRDLDVLRLEHHVRARAMSRRQQIADDLALGVDGDRTTAGQLGQIDPMTGATKRDVQAFVTQSLARQAAAEAGVVKQIDGGLLEHARPYALDDVLLAPALDGNRVDASLLEEVAQQQSGGPRADDADGDTRGGHGSRHCDMGPGAIILSCRS